MSVSNLELMLPDVTTHTCLMLVVGVSYQSCWKASLLVDVGSMRSKERWCCWWREILLQAKL